MAGAVRAGAPRPAPVAVTAADRAAVNPFAALSGVLRRPLTSYFILLASAGLLLMLGLIMVLSASSIDSYADSGSAFTVFLKQLTWALIGVPAFWLALALPPTAFRMLGYPLLGLSVVLLALLLVPGLGKTVNGATLWLEFGPVQLQPVELAKPALALWGAAVLVRKRTLIGRWRHLAVPLLPGVAVVLLLVGPEDVGSMFLLIVLVGALLWVAGVRLRLFLVPGMVALAAGTAFVLAEEYRLARVLSFRDPFADPEGTGFQAVHGLYSLATGGWWGVGLGQSREKWQYLPEAHNDFIFAVIGEELGVVGCLVVILLFALFTYAGLRIARRVDDPFRQLVAASCTMWLAAQALVNMGAVVGLLPITGVPLPLISAGGSSLVLTMFVIGMLASFARTEPEAAAALRARGRTRTQRIFLIRLPAGRPGGSPPARTPGFRRSTLSSTSVRTEPAVPEGGRSTKAGRPARTGGHW